jgi:hypothetical protein
MSAQSIVRAVIDRYIPKEILMKSGLFDLSKFIAGVFACAVLALPAANAATITNGSFETPVVTPGTFTLFNVGSSGLTGWTVVGPAGTDVATVSTTFSQNGVTFQAQDGVQWLDLTGLNSNNAEGVAQAVSTTAGNRYQLSYFIGNTTGGGIFGTTSTVNVQVNGVQTFSDVNAAVSPTAQNWLQVTHTFVASGPSTMLTFLNGDPASDNDNGLDNIAILDLGPAVGAVPEPETYALLLGGLALLGFTARRRKT